MSMSSAVSKFIEALRNAPEVTIIAECDQRMVELLQRGEPIVDGPSVLTVEDPWAEDGNSL